MLGDKYDVVRLKEMGCFLQPGVSAQLLREVCSFKVTRFIWLLISQSIKLLFDASLLKTTEGESPTSVSVTLTDGWIDNDSSAIHLLSEVRHIHFFPQAKISIISLRILY